MVAPTTVEPAHVQMQMRAQPRSTVQDEVLEAEAKAAAAATKHLERWTDGITTFLLAGGLAIFALLLVTLPNALTRSGEMASLGWFVPAVVLCGALGAWIHAAQSFAGFVGTKRFTARWGRWYLLRPMIGGFLAFLLLVLSLAGVVPGLDESRGFLVLGVATVLGLVARPVVDKALDVFEALLDSGRNRRRASADEHRQDG